MSKKKNNADGDRDTIFARVLYTLLKLNNGEGIKTSELAKEFNVAIRTIQRDMQTFFSLPLGKKVNIII